MLAGKTVPDDAVAVPYTVLSQAYSILLSHALVMMLVKVVEPRKLLLGHDYKIPIQWVGSGRGICSLHAVGFRETDVERLLIQHP